MSDFKFKVGDKITKPKGYKFEGIIVAVFETTSGEKRVVAELEDNGMLHIFSEQQLEQKLKHDCVIENTLMHGTLDGYSVSVCKICKKIIWQDSLS